MTSITRASDSMPSTIGCGTAGGAVTTGSQGGIGPYSATCTPAPSEIRVTLAERSSAGSTSRMIIRSDSRSQMPNTKRSPTAGDCSMVGG